MQSGGLVGGWLLSFRILSAVLVVYGEMASKDSAPNFSEFSNRIFAAIDSLEERVSALAAGDLQATRVSRVPAARAADVPTLTKPGHADQFKFCDDVKRIAASALESAQHDEEVQLWITD